MNSIEYSRKKILFLITKSNWGGAQKYVYDLATNLDQNKFNIKVICGGHGILIDKLKEKNIEIINLETLERDINILKEIKNFYFIFKILLKEKPDIIHLNSAKISGIAAFCGRIIGIKKIIFTTHGWAFNEERTHFKKTLIFYFSLFTSILSTDIVSVSKKVKDDLMHRIEISFFAKLLKPLYFKNLENKIKIINLSIKEIEFKNDFPFKINKEKINIITIAELHKIKGHEIAIMSFIKINNDNFVYHIIGDGDEKNNLENKIKENNLENKIILYGQIPNISQYLKNFDLFLFTSQSESFGYVILEASLAGLPIISHNVGASEKILENYKQKIILNIYDFENQTYKNKLNNFRIKKEEQIKNLTLKLNTILSIPKNENQFLIKAKEEEINNIKNNFNIEKMLFEIEKIFFN